MRRRRHARDPYDGEDAAELEEAEERDRNRGRGYLRDDPGDGYRERDEEPYDDRSDRREDRRRARDAGDYERQAYGPDADRHRTRHDPEIEYEGRWHRGPGPRDEERPVGSYQSRYWDQPLRDEGRGAEERRSRRREEPRDRLDSRDRFAGTEDAEDEREPWGSPAPWLHEDHTGKGPRAYRRTDERLQDEACEVLARHAGIDATDIEVETNEGVVTLRGEVRDRRTKRLAEDTVQRVYGVHDVQNHLRVSRGR